jgi:hypothetical protein
LFQICLEQHYTVGSEMLTSGAWERPIFNYDL